MVLSVFTELWKHHRINFRTFLSPPKETWYPLVVLHFPPASSSPALSNFQTKLLSVSIDLPIVDISYKWNKKYALKIQ